MVTVLIVCVFLLFSHLVQAFTQIEQTTNQDYVTPESMQIYAQTIIDTYIQLSNEYFPSKLENLTFYSNLAYSIEYYTSSQGGAAIWIKPSTISSFNTITTNDRIETAVFGGDYDLAPMFNVVGEETITAYFQAQLGNHPYLKLVYEHSGQIVHHILINRTTTVQEYYVLVIKGSEQTKYWTLDLARSEALEMLKIDFRFAFAYSQEFTQLSAIPAITAVMRYMQDNLNNTEYTEIEYLADLQKIRDLAIQFDINTTILNELRDFVIAKDTGIIPIFPSDFLSIVTLPIPDKKIFNLVVSDPQNIIYISLLSIALVFGFAIGLFSNYYKSTKKPRERKFLLTIPLGFLGWFISDALYYRPYDLSLIQAIIIILISSIGVTLVYLKRQHLRSLAFRTKKSQTRENP